MNDCQQAQIPLLWGRCDTKSIDSRKIHLAQSHSIPMCAPSPAQLQSQPLRQLLVKEEVLAIPKGPALLLYFFLGHVVPDWRSQHPGEGIPSKICWQGGQAAAAAEQPFLGLDWLPLPSLHELLEAALAPGCQLVSRGSSIPRRQVPDIWP